jgi:pimeloyl-ACP methyl ester carboxylesterase
MATKKTGDAPKGAHAGGLHIAELQTVRGPVPALMGGPKSVREMPLFYLHGEGGLSAADPFLLELAQTRRVVAPPAYGQAFAAAIPHARLTIVPEAGHMPHWERPLLVKEAAGFG